ncbi:MAG: GntR family transcriptional regulator [Chloroflexi bacterium]|nr:MAG: GntR family transcriptional regulator [Chloroflexota bacterium]
MLLGFLENEAFKGPSVRSFTSKDLWEIYAVRASLESLAAREAAVRLTPENAVQLRCILDKMILAAQNQDQTEMVRLDNEFHETIIKISGNQVLYQLWQNLRFGYWTIVTTRMLSYDLEELARRHETLLEAVHSRNPQRAMAAMQHHIEDLGRPPQGPDP